MRRITAVIIGLLIPLNFALAAAFSDVPGDHPNATAIYGLQRLGVIKGNPDGSFAPDRELNRAEFMTMIYRAADKTTRAIYAGCFPDVPTDAWYSDVFCTAKHNGDIKGYPDGTGKPEQFVNAVEALKMILSSLNFTVPPLTQEDRLSLDLLGVTHSSWYAPYLHRALTLNLVPAELTANNRFDPGGPIMRKFAAELIWRALNTEDTIFDDDEEPEKPEISQEPEMTPTGATVTDFPLHRTGQTGERGAAAYAFDLDTDGTVLVEAVNLTSELTGIQCFLYLLGESGFTFEFFIGYQEGGACYIRGALRAGRYQVEVRSRSEGAEYSLDVPTSEGDGNDGFVEAVVLRVGAPRSNTLQANDYEDWFTFRVAAVEMHRVKLTDVDNLTCTIYPADNVELSGFSSPICNESFEYQPGTYYISIQRSPPAAESQSYTVELR